MISANYSAFTPEFVGHTFLYKDGKAEDLGTQILSSALNNFADIVGTDNIVSPYGKGWLGSWGFVHFHCELFAHQDR